MRQWTMESVPTEFLLLENTELDQNLVFYSDVYKMEDVKLEVALEYKFLLYTDDSLKEVLEKIEKNPALLIYSYMCLVILRLINGSEAIEPYIKSEILKKVRYINSIKEQNSSSGSCPHSVMCDFRALIGCFDVYLDAWNQKVEEYQKKKDSLNKARAQATSQHE